MSRRRFPSSSHHFERKALLQNSHTRQPHGRRAGPKRREPRGCTPVCGGSASVPLRELQLYMNTAEGQCPALGSGFQLYIGARLRSALRWVSASCRTLRLMGSAAGFQLHRSMAEGSAALAHGCSTATQARASVRRFSQSGGYTRRGRVSCPIQ